MKAILQAGVCKIALAARLLPLLLWALPVLAQAQYTYTTNSGKITITRYIGSGGSAAIPSVINLLPVTSLGTSSFYYCTSLTNVTIPDSITNIGARAFYYCTNLARVTIGTGVTSIGVEAFRDCRSLTNVTIPSNVTVIGDSTFYYCTNLTSAIIGNGVTIIGYAAFYHCSSLTNVTIPSNVTVIGDSAFDYCTSLTRVTIPYGVTHIGDFVFRSCTNLISVTIPGSVTSIGDYALYKCYNLAGAYFKGNAPDIGSRVFLSNDVATVYYILGTTGWGTTFGNRPTALWTGVASTEMDVRGNSISITNGAATPSLADYTDFGSALVAGEIVVRTFGIRNMGDAVLNLTGSPRVAVGGAQASEFTVTAQPATPVRSDATATFQVTFDPAGAGIRSAMLSIANNDSDENPYNFAIQGTGDTNISRRPTLSWSPTAGATWYQIWISRSGTKYYEKWLNQAGATWTATFDFQGGSYQWWVRSYSDSAGMGAWQGPGTFAVAAMLPGVPTLFSPAGVVATNRPAFAWSEDPPTTAYNLYVKRDNNAYLNTWVSGLTGFTPTSNIALGSYQWWVRGWNPDGYGAWSYVTGFTYGLSAPLTPTGIVAGTRKPEFYWTAAPGASWYCVYVKKAGEAYQQRWIAGVTSLTFAADMPGTNYQWWVRTWNSSGYGPWSTGVLFSVPFVAPGVTVPVSPVGTATGSVVSYVWQADPVATWHNIYVRRNGAKWRNEWYPAASRTGNITNAISGHTAGASYQWFVRGWSPDGYGGWSSGTTFISQ